ncbi:MAG: secreted protein with CotH lamin and Por secretion system C-terminal sorting [Prolixibacteraceae bacterium]|nr:MAG: secreted protein with CotH lamin and Por secretion system C-terminal sorting [Prolixibacteraceae bacterium]
MKLFLLISFLVLYALIIDAQILTSSNLPIVIINTNINPNTGKPYEIPDDPKIGATMKIIFRPDGSRNYLTDQNNPDFLNYNGRIGVEIRGSSSQSLPKKAYGLTTRKEDNFTNNNVSILGMPNENDWILNSIAFDPSLIRNYLSYDLARSMGNYAARGEYCEVVINGDYRGLYIFMEKLKIDDDRINIVKMTNTDNTVPDLTGGYVTKADKTTGGDPVAWTMQSYIGSTSYLHDSPKPNEITTQQNNYIRNQFTILQNAATAQNASIINGFPSIIDVPSFIDYILISELASNADSYQYSTYFHKDRNGKLRAGPIWDYDLTYGNDLFHWGLDRSHTNVWQFDNWDNTGSKFWKDLYNNPTFKCYLTKRWKELTATNGPLNYFAVAEKMEQLSKLTSEAMVRENIRWGTIPNQSGEIIKMKEWIQTRINWINTRLTNYTACSNPDLPALVISKINYNPLPVNKFDSDDLEFIEITNNSNQTINLTGFYFSELGVTYQFPANSTLNAHTNLILAGNSNTFQQFYGSIPFGQFTRNLSNKSEKIVLADAFGNTIDSVRYLDSLPWPVEADGGGYFLKLKDVYSDNSLAENWTIATNLSVDIDDNLLEYLVNIYPNPAQSKITIESNQIQLISFELFDLSGRKMTEQNNINSSIFTIDVESFMPGIYILKLHSGNKDSFVKKFIKK